MLSGLKRNNNGSMHKNEYVVVTHPVGNKKKKSLHTWRTQSCLDAIPLILRADYSTN